MDILTAVGTILVIMSVLSVSHRNLNTKISSLEDKSREYITESQLRRILGDKLEKYSIQLDDLKADSKELEHKIDKLIEILRK